MTRPRPVFRARNASALLGLGCARLATLTFAPPRPKRAEADGRKTNYRKKFTPATLKDKFITRLSILIEIEGYKKAKIEASHANENAIKIEILAEKAKENKISEDNWLTEAHALHNFSPIISYHGSLFCKYSLEESDLNDQARAFNQQAVAYCKDAQSHLDNISKYGLLIRTQEGINSGQHVLINPVTGMPATRDEIADFSNLPVIPPFLMKTEIDNEIQGWQTGISATSETPKPSESSAFGAPAGIANSPDLDAKIIKYLIQYADSGIDSSQYTLGVRYLEGNGVPQDLSKGVSYLKKAAEQGNEDAKRKLKTLGK